MNRCDRRLDVILGEIGTGGGEFEEFEPFTHQFLVPLRSILIDKRDQITGGVDSCSADAPRSDT